MNWWESNKLRLVQNNLREPDAELDVDLLIQELKAFHANVLMMNAGGIFAFYPSKLEYHYVTPYLKKDLLKEAIDKAHAAGIRFIARFDFSKAHESIYAKQPNWFYRTEDGDAVNYHGIVHACLNGGYQQQYSLNILEEALSQYDVDGVFFNMFGYQNWDYSGNQYGICHCVNCRQRFADMYGLELPGRDRQTKEQLAAYREFQRVTAADILDQIHARIKSLKPDAAICTYHPHKVDIVRHESNTSLTRPYPKWLYSAAENVMPIMGSYSGKLISNCSINAIDLTYRFTGVSGYENEIRLYENMANGSGLDFCIIGTFEDYPDQANLDGAKQIYRFHKQYEHLFGQFDSVAEVVLVKPTTALNGAMEEYRGLFKILKEAHLLFDVVKQERLSHIEQTSAAVVLIPGITALAPDQLETLIRLRRRGVHIAATGAALTEQPEALEGLFDAALMGVATDTTAAYVQVDDKRMFAKLGRREWVIINGFAAFLQYGENAERRLPMVSAATFGPPERAYGHKLTDRYMVGITPQAEGATGRGAYIGWKVGELYGQQGFADHKLVVEGVIDELLGGRRRLATDAHSSVEITLFRLPDGTLLLQLVNLSGFNGVTYQAPIPLRNIRIQLAGIEGVSAISEAEGLGACGEVQLAQESDCMILSIAELQAYGAYHLK
jgi:hypothetical protein